MGRDSSDGSESPLRTHRSSRRSPSRRERSPGRHRSSYSEKSPVQEKPSSRTKSSKHTRSRSPFDSVPAKEPPSRSAGSRSPSPRSKRLRRDRADRKDDKSSERGHDQNYGKTRSPVRAKSRSRSPSPRTRRLMRAQADKADKLSDRGTRKERNLEGDRRERKSRRDEDYNGSYKTKESEQHRSRRRSRSPQPDEGKNLRDGDHRNGDDDDSVVQMKAAAEALETKEKQKPSFELSGKLAAETNRVNEPLYVHRQTCYLFGRERRVADIPTDHPSCSKQHAVLQYRQVEKEQPDGMLAKEVRPYIMDLGSTNGTFINENRIEPERYYELMEKDTLKFGNSSREYVMLHENSAG
ncbi:uncharacterized protein [Rutidosis leptorrhynchoides]|uniref:uncharacterized protein isoform X2 n=1 Tax=Rutidosis leptorrhynchoides TaxID=125765 RepID=UPI003A98FF8F